MDSVASQCAAGTGAEAAVGDMAGPCFRAARLLIDAPTVPPDATSGAVYDLLVARPDVPCIPILDGHRVVGLADRVSLLNRFARHLMRDYYVRRPVSLVFDTDPLIVDCDTPIQVLAELISLKKPQALTAGFVITSGGRYAGVGTALDTMRASVEEAQLQAEALMMSRRAADEANRTKTLFLANMSHEFRTPLNAIIGFAEVLQSQSFGPMNARQAEYVEDIRASGMHLLELVNDILDISKAESGKLELHEEEVPLDELVATCLRPVRERAREGGLALNTMLPDAAVEIVGDAVKLRQIVVNLLSNAVKFTPRGGQVDVKAALMPDGSLEIAVIDTGIGMSPEQIPLALQAFVQIDNSRNRSYQGTGLGLPLCKQLTEFHGGCLTVESELGKGSTMRVRLPAFRVRTIANEAAA